MSDNISLKNCEGAESIRSLIASVRVEREQMRLQYAADKSAAYCRIIRDALDCSKASLIHGEDAEGCLPHNEYSSGTCRCYIYELTESQLTEISELAAQLGCQLKLNSDGYYKVSI